MQSLMEMCEFVYQYILDALKWLFGELEIECKMLFGNVAAPPTALHLFDADSGNLDAYNRLPFIKKCRQEKRKLFLVPEMQKLMQPLARSKWK